VANASRYINVVKDILSAVPDHEVGALRDDVEAEWLFVQLVSNGPAVVRRVFDERGERICSGNPQTYVVGAAANLEFGDISEAERHIKRARSLLNMASMPSPSLAIQVELLQAQIEWSRTGDDAAMIRKCDVAKGIAQANQLSGHALLAAHLFDVAKWSLNGDADARSRSRKLEAQLDHTAGLPRLYQFDAYCSFADAEFALGDPWRAVRWADRASEIALTRSAKVYLKSLSCKGYARAGRIDKAAQLAEDVVLNSERGVSGRAQLNARWTLGEAAFRRGNLSNAYDQFQEAAQLAHRFGTCSIMRGIERRLSQLSGQRLAGR
jgi:tetratricopeptide (TPR) repeat protein